MKMRAQREIPQPEPISPWLLWGWLAFVISFFLPAVGDRSDHFRGWETACISAMMLVEVTKKFDDEMVYFGLFTTCNFIMLATPLLRAKLPRTRSASWTAAGICAASSLFAGSFLFQDQIVHSGESGAMFGYYVWFGSMVLVTIGFVRRAIDSSDRSAIEPVPGFR